MSVKINDISYLSFQGGGGKGFIYMGVVKALEKAINGKEGVPIISIINPDLSIGSSQRHIKGISGASAGAITAYLLSLGMSSSEVEMEMEVDDQTKMALGPYDKTPVLKPVNRFEKFFENGRFDQKLREVNDNFGATQRIHKNNRLGGTINYLSVEALRYFLNNDFTTHDKNNTLIEKLLYTDRKESTSVPVLPIPPPFTPFYVHRSYEETNAGAHLGNLIYNRGLINGLAVREYFKDVTRRKIHKIINAYFRYYKGEQPKHNFKNVIYHLAENPEKMTFRDHFRLTGVNLVITGTNLTQHLSKYFSVYHTPDFPVIEAVALSMNLPFLFKPVFVTASVNREETQAYNNEYKGLWVDGGMLNNFPLNAFNKLKTMSLKIFDNDVVLDVAANSFNSDADFKKNTLGFRLEPEPIGEDIFNDNEALAKKLFEANSGQVVSAYLGDIFKTFMFPGSKGQIRNKVEEEYSITVNDAASVGTGREKTYYEWQLTDFASPKLTKLRKPKGDKEYRYKELLIEKAHEDVSKILKIK
ncbi:patatin-like phospholipase family protein [Kordia sp. YSTF-M3]|uniref:Patatin-like phospholipase family protein n=1 Tax=Kordia aestuariivivens TaxID=2759037 RepID=A0ABR7QFE5_9FLAO|nr:patatin-like phospholipase family protein [Kordia aestuariivivens]MBC8757292.1 patatin-like phospholipase family protein [Kordia aestuariivivens]